MAGLAFNARLIIAKVVGADGTVSLPAEVAAIRWAVAQGARVINLVARRCARSARPGARHLLAARAGGGRVRLLEGCGRRRGGRERAAVARDAVGLRPLSGGAAARDRRQRRPTRRLGAGVLEPRRRLQRPRRARRRHLLDDPAAARRPPGRLCRTSLFRLWLIRVQGRDRHLVRRAAGVGRGGAPDRRATVVDAGSGRVAARTKRRRCERAHRLCRVPARPRQVHGLGTARRPLGADAAW